MKIAILTSPNQWFVHYAQYLSEELGNVAVYYNHEDIDGNLDVLFVLSYHKIIEDKYLKKNKHNIIIHESDLPEGKGLAPLFWQILEGRNEIVFTMFEADIGVDNGDIYMKRSLQLNGTELNEELRYKQATLIIDMCKEFVKDYDRYKNPVPQEGRETYYEKRTPRDSKLDVDKTIRQQFNLLRVVNNKEYPAYFELNGKRYRITIELDGESS